MSQASKQVDWCLRKAEKEIEECKKLGKRLKHRGLLKVEADVEEAKRHLEKAKHNLNAIIKFKEIGFSDWSITAAFYTIYQCFLAIAAKFGYESSNQRCTIALMEHLKEQNKINIDQKYIDMLKPEELEEEKEDSIIDMREHYTYSIKIEVEDESKISELINTCKELIDITKDVIYD